MFEAGGLHNGISPLGISPETPQGRNGRECGRYPVNLPAEASLCCAGGLRGVRERGNQLSMENSRPTRRPRRMREPRGLGLSLAGTPPLRNSMRPLELLSQDQLMAIHEASLKLLEETGIEFMGAAARQKFRAGRCRGERLHGPGEDSPRAGGRGAEDGAVFLRADAAQSGARHPCRRESHLLRPGGRARPTSMTASPGGGSGNYKDYISLIKLAQSFDIIHFIGNQPTSPQELPVAHAPSRLLSGERHLFRPRLSLHGDRPEPGAGRHHHDGDLARQDARADPGRSLAC